MDFFMGRWKTIVGETDESQQNPADTVEQIVGRILTSTHTADRRDACRALKSLSRTYRVEVGAQGMTALIDVLRDESCDTETIGYALDTLNNVTSTEPSDDSNSESDSDACDHSAHIGVQFSEIFIKSAENVKMVINRLEEYNFKIRWPAVKLLTSLIRSRTKEIQEIILTSPMASSKVMDLLSDSREIIRNDALILLTHLAKGNINVQKIIAFENGFERLFEVIQNEGNLNGGVVTEDSLTLIYNLLKNNSSNQNFFKESSYIQRLTPLMLLGDIEEHSWAPQLISNAYLVLQIIRTLVSTNNTQVNVSSSQCAIRNCALLEALCSILMKNGVPVRILTETINTVAEIIRGNKKNQEYIDCLMAPCTPPQSALLILLMSMVNEKQVFELRCAVLYCFQSFLHQNESGQEKIVQTLIPTSENTCLTVGQLLCGGLISNETLTNWLSANALMHVLLQGQSPKEQLLRVLLAKSDNNLSISLLQKCTTILQNRTEVQTRIGILMLLCAWLAASRKSVKAFMLIPGICEYLVSEIIGNDDNENEVLYQGLCAFLLGNCLEYSDNIATGFNREQLYQSIEKRIGLETFVNKIGEISRHSHYSVASKTPCIQVVAPAKLLLDYSFCKLFKNTEGTITNNILKQNTKEFGHNEATVNDGDVINQYKYIIREQDEKLQALQAAIRQTEEKYKFLEDENLTLKQKNSKLNDQNILYRAQLTAKRSTENTEFKPNNIDASPLDNTKLQADNGIRENQGQNTNQPPQQPNGNGNSAPGDQDDLIELLLHQETLIQQYRDKFGLIELTSSIQEI